MRPGAFALAVPLCLLTFAACDQTRLQNAAGDIAFAEPKLDLGQAWPDDVLSAKATLRNRGRSPLPLEWTLPEGGFTFEGLPSNIPSGDVTFTVRFRSSEPKVVNAKLVVTSGSQNRAELELVAETKAIPQCPTPVTCHTTAFDKAKGACVETPVDDGTACDPHSACVLNPSCQAGRCVGTQVACDDGDACTLDGCNALTGCTFVPAPPCPGDGVCNVGVCNPKTGCGLAPATDGTACGEVTCDAAQVCISGACTTRDPPDGYICAEASPCQGQGVCQGSVCARPAAVPLSPTWSFNSAAQDPQPFLHDFVLEPNGDATLMGFFSTPVRRANTSTGGELSGPARRCIVWNAQLVCADFDEQRIDGTVAMLDLATGNDVWRFNLAAHRPDYASGSDALFMARVAALGTDRLAALFEAYPRGSPSGSNCRDYYLVVLDAGGQMVSAAKLTAPMLQQCNHPHPYGVVSDNAGNLYVAFSPSSNGGAPLAAQAPTLLMSFDRDGVQRWTREETYQGGELAVANGLLFPEGALLPYDTATGAQVPDPGGVAARGPMGRVVASWTRYVESPTVGAFVPANTVHGYLTSGQLSWTHTLPGQDVFVSRELRAVTWRPRAAAQEKTAVLGMTVRGGKGALTALDLDTGAELWMCPVNASFVTPPQLFEVAQQKLMVMGDATTCGDCDPPFAGSNGAFYSFDVPGLSSSGIPWSGTFGGPDHDHLENGLPLPGTSQPN